MGGVTSSFFGREDSTLPDQPNGWLWDDIATGANITIRQAYERYVLGATKPPEQQFQRHYDATKTVFVREGYSEKEIKWWFLRTGQGPKCYRQYGVGGACQLPPYDVWYNWYIAKQAGIAPDPCFYVWADRRNADCYLIPSHPLYPPPGYRMPGLPCNTAGKRFDPNTDAWSMSGGFWGWMDGSMPWAIPDLPELTGDRNSYAFGRSFDGAFDAVGIIGAGFCSDLEVEETAGLLHPLPLAWTVFMPSSIRVSFGPMPPIRGLPIGAMALLDKASNKQWPDFFGSRLQGYLMSTDWRTAYKAWPLALRDTIAQFGMTDATLLKLSAKLIEASDKGIASYQRKRGPTLLMAGGKYAQIFTAVVISFITAGIASAAMALVSEALVAAEVATAAEIAAVAENVQTAQTAYSVAKEVTSGDPNLLSLASGLLSLNETFGVVGADVDVSGAVAYDYSFDGIEPVSVGGDQLAFDYTGDGLMTLDLGEAADLTSTMMTDALNEIDLDHDYTGVDFSGIAAGEMQAAVDNIVANLDQFAGDPNALYEAIEIEATVVTNSMANAATVVMDNTAAADTEAALAEIMADDASIAASTDVGPLTVDQLDMEMLDEGWTAEETTGMDYQQAVEETTPVLEEAVAAAADMPIETIETILKVAEQIASVVEPAVIAPPPPPPPPPAPAQIVAAPAPSQPAPGEVATVTYTPEQAVVIDGEQGIPLITAGFGPAVAPDGEKGFNLWWLLPLGLLAIPMGEKRRTRKRTRK